ncbi:ribonuclease 2 [Andrographis paniculata]|uniref:ribonuclease 2 n=1 Tax=Andrographis paniculata TaxID=175694 RepID=UPI0021E74604|nr:ribonuclease 2 [Andrographis paniculata]
MASLSVAIRSVFLFATVWIGVFGQEIGAVVDGGNLHSREFDYFNLALQWPGTYCSKTRHCCSSNGCCRGSDKPTGFTIHGLWADYNDGSWPSCCSGKKFDIKEISTLLGALNKYWPSLSCSSSSNCHGGKGLFWEHEVEKHGTCSASVTGDEYNYFLTALNLYFKYNVTEVLLEAGYVPSNSEKYPTGGIISAIQNAFHLTPKLECENGALEEVHLCFDKKFEPRDCAVKSSNVLRSSKSCPTYVSFPDYFSPGLGLGIGFGDDGSALSSRM